jgi:hypothetical protein
MTKIIRTSLPHAGVALQLVKDQQTRDAIMKLSENITALKRSLNELQEAVIEIQRKKV